MFRRLTLLSIPLLMSVSQTAEAACSVYRGVSYCKGGDCTQSAEEDFARYRKSELECGVRESSAPFIMKTTNPQKKGTVVLVHGLAATPAHMQHVAEELRADGYNVVAPILKGHGGSEEFLLSADLNEWKADLKFAGDVAEKMEKPLYIMGHSTGGAMAGLEASLRPEKYKAVVGLDPAMNINGEQGNKLRLACLAKLSPAWKFPEDISSGLLGILANWKACNTSEVGRMPEITRIINELDAKTMTYKYCGDNFSIPEYNQEFTLQSLCALARATAEMTPERIAKLPPSLMVLSQDKKLFGIKADGRWIAGVVSKNDIVTAVKSQPRNEVVESEAPFHQLMLARCSPGFSRYMPKVKGWLANHR